MQDKDFRRTRDDRPPAGALTDHADAQSRINVAALMEDGLLVSLAVAVGVLQDEDAIAVGAGVFLATIVRHLADPDAAGGIDVDVRRT